MFPEAKLMDDYEANAYSRMIGKDYVNVDFDIEGYFYCLKFIEKTSGYINFVIHGKIGYSFDIDVSDNLEETLVSYLEHLFPIIAWT